MLKVWTVINLLVYTIVNKLFNYKEISDCNMVCKIIQFKVTWHFYFSVTNGDINTYYSTNNQINK